MYIFFTIPQIIYNVWWVYLIYVILIFPFLLNISFIYVKKQYANIKVKLFGIRVLDVYLEFGIIKLTLFFKRKYIEVEYFKLLPINKAVKELFDIKIRSIKTNVLYSSKILDRKIKMLMALNFYNLLTTTYSNIKDFSSKNTITFTDNREYFKYQFNVKLFFNFITLIIALTKIIIGKIIKWKKKITE